MDDSGPGSASLKNRLKRSICCCFGQRGAYLSSTTTTPRPLLHSSSTSHRSPELKHICRNLIIRIASRSRRRRRSYSTDFGYDPLSYALNFQEADDLDTQADEYFPLRNFTARLPQSPTRMPMSAPAAAEGVPPLTEFSRPQRTNSDGVVGRTVGMSREITVV